MSKGFLHIVGLGPGEAGQITLESFDLMQRYPVYLRTAVHPTVSFLKQKGIAYENFDRLYEEAESFDEIYQKIAEEIVLKAKLDEIVYAVPGNPLFGETSVKKILTLCRQEDVAYHVYPAVSFVDVCCDSLEIDPVDGLLVCDAFDLTGDEDTVIEADPSVDLLITQVYNSWMASEVKLTLSKLYDEDTPIKLLYHAGLEDESIQTMPLYELDRANVDHLCSVFVGRDRRNYRKTQSLLSIMNQLRAPDGCPWDREQTHESLRDCLIEESYEVLDAIDQMDYENLQEELGDLLLQIVFHAKLAEEEGAFDYGDVVEGICEKMIRRHPHVFGTENAESSEEVLINWDKIKEKEKKTGTVVDEMHQIPVSYTALMTAQKIQKKARKTGFDWDEAVEALEKVAEELDEAKESLREGNRDAIFEEFGDLMFAVTNAARLADVYAEDALREANRKFMRRFSGMIALSKEDGKDFEKLSLEEQEAYWQAVKKKEKSE